MGNNREEEETFPLWIHRGRKIVSFQEAEGFEKLEYPTHEEMFQNAIELSMKGFAIQ